ncbi:MerR family transcriptional regulator [Actinocorallia sp. B10E7]|uniref:MerR family transcriptional regulator n=1 Tax=Actinocorallia sp. B10E7 TaxID=3153558 RepID=UPI00325E1C5F
MGIWTISELASRAADALADLEVNGRVQDVPNERLIRWYTTLGLLDPPLRRGRTARYTGRHLLQLVAVKRRQAAGRTLAEIQAELAGAPLETLLMITGPLPGAGRPAPAPPAPPRRFWAAPSPAPVSDASDPSNAPSATSSAEAVETVEDTSPVDVRWASDTGSGRAEAASARGRTEVAPEGSAAMQGVRLGPGVTLLLETAALSAEDVAALRAAAAPLLDELIERGLLAEASTREEGEPHHL